MKVKFVTKIIAFMLCVSLMNLPAIFANSEDYQNIEGYEQFERLNNMMIEGIEETEEIYNSEMMEYIEYDDTRFIDKGISIYDQYMADEENKIELIPVTDEELAMLQNNYYNQSRILEYPFEFNIISNNGNDVLIELIPYVSDYEFSVSIPSVKGDVYYEKVSPIGLISELEMVSPIEIENPFDRITKSTQYITITPDTEYTFNFVEISGDIKNTYIGNIKLTSYISDYGKVISDNFSSETRMVDDIFQEKSTTIEIYEVYEYTSYNEDLSNERMENDLSSPIMSLMGVGTKYEAESNNTYSSSDLTYDDYDNYGMISYSGDIDWWRVSFSSSGDANFWLGNIPSSCDYDIQLVSSNGSTVIGSSTKGGTADELITYAVTANTTYYVKIYGYNSYSSSQYYWFRAKNYPTQGSTGDIYEPNNTTGTSTILGNSPSGTLTANIHATSDIDFYRFNMTAARNFSVYLSNIPSGCNYDIQLLNSSGSVIGISNNGGTNIEYIDLALPVGTYYIRVYSSSGYNLASNYSLTMSTYTGGSTGGDQYEPNDSTSNARTVALNTTISANIHSATDADFYRITVTNTMTLSLSLTNIPSGCDYDMRLLDSMGSVITSSSAGSNGNESISRSLTQGTYFIQIYPYSGYNANSNYSLAIGAGGGSTPGGDQYEPNNTQGSATNIGSQPNTTIYSSIHVTDDVDCFKFTLTSVSNVTITLSNAPSTCHYSATIRDANLGFASDIIFSGQGTNSSTTTAYSLPVGTYYIAVIPYMGYSATTNYRLDVSTVINASGGGDTYEPNNSTATAYNIGTNPLTSIQATIHNTSDVDYYKFTLNSSYVTSINLSTISSGCNYDLTLLNSSGVAIQGSQMGGTYPENILRTLSSGTYYIKVHSYSGYSSGNKYTLSVYVGSDDYEYNDTIENATILGTLSNTANASYTYDSSVTDEVPFEREETEFNEYIGEKSPLNTIDSLSTQARLFAIYGKISSSTDKDKYMVYAPAGQTFDVELSNVPSSYNYRFRIMNSSQQILYTSGSGAGLMKVGSYTPSTSGEYYIEVFSDSGYSNSDSYKYFLVVALRDQYEPNNTLSISGAKDLGTITSSQQLNDASIHIRSDQDYYRFYIPNTGNVNIVLSNIANGCDYDLQLYDSNGGSPMQTSSQGSNVNESITRTLNAGYYYVRVYSKNNATCSGQYYSLSINTSVDLSNKIFTLKNESSKLYLNIAGSADANWVTVNQYADDGTMGEQFIFIYDAAYGAYTINPLCSSYGYNRSLYKVNNSLQLSDTTAKTYWDVIPISGNQYNIKLHDGTQYMTSSGSSIILTTPTGGNDQKWILGEVLSFPITISSNVTKSSVEIVLDNLAENKKIIQMTSTNMTIRLLSSKIHAINVAKPDYGRMIHPTKITSNNAGQTLSFTLTDRNSFPSYGSPLSYSSSDISSVYGWRNYKTGAPELDYHTGIDIPKPLNTQVYSVSDGDVNINRFVNGCGNTVQILTNKTYYITYMHLNYSDIPVNVLSVEKDDKIGKVGNTNYIPHDPTMKYHLHLSISTNPSVSKGDPNNSSQFNMYFKDPTMFVQ